MTITFRTLGAIDLRSAGRGELSTVLAQPKRVALLIFLAVARPRGFHRRDRIVALFWPELDESHARQALNRAVHQLRRGLGDDAILSRGDEELSLGDGVECDARQLDDALAAGDLARALELHTGELADGLFIDDALEFERWLDEERRRIRKAVAAAAGRLAEEALRAGNAATAVEYATRLVTLLPDDEPGVRLRMRALVAAGDRVGALRAYEEFAARVAGELESEPSAETRELAASLRHRPGHSARADAIPIADLSARSAAEVAASPPSPPPRRRARVAALVALALLGTAAGVLAWRRHPETAATRALTLHENRVLVAELENQTGDSTLDVIGTMAMDFMSQGVASAALVEVVDPAAAVLMARGVDTLDSRGDAMTWTRVLAVESGAGLVISGAYTRAGDSLLFTAHLSDMMRGTVARTFQPVRAPVHAPTEALADLRRQAIEVVAEAAEPRLAQFSRGAARPPSYAAYVEYVRGIDLFVAREERRAFDHFVRAAELDTSFALAVLSASNTVPGFDDERIERWLARLAARRESLPPIQRLWLDQRLAVRRNDLAEAHRLSGELARLSPGSMWPYFYALVMHQRGYARRARDLILEIDPDRGWMKGWYSYWAARAMFRHSLGEYEEELRDADLGRARFPGNMATLTARARALAALGRRAELDATLTEALTTPHIGSWNAGSALGVAALEARAHSHADWIPALRASALGWYESLTPEERNHEAESFGHSWVLYAVGATSELERRLARLNRELPPRPELLGYEGVLAARRGDRGGALRADHALARIAEGISSERPRVRFQARDALYRRAQIAAALGDRRRALNLLRSAIVSAYGSRVYIHSDPAFEPLWGDAEFRALVDPRE
jgi:serine/threonine-protein kinase